MKRLVVEQLERRRDQMISSLWANSNYDDDKGTRRNAIQEIEANFQQAIDTVTGVAEQEAELDDDNPFLQAAKRGVEKIQQVANPDGKVVDVVNPDYTEIDQ